MDRFLQYSPVICFGVLFALFIGLWIINEKSNKNTKYEEISADICQQTVDNTPQVSTEFTDVTDDDAVINKPGPIQPEIPLPIIAPKKCKKPSIGESLCLQTMQNIYGVPFVKVHPKWLENPESKVNLELDCYNDDLKIAVEYNGEQHYKWPNFFHKTQEEFIKQVRRDQLKHELCERNGVYLITVPYNVSHKRIAKFIISQLPETVQKRIQEENNICKND